jgi:NADH-quinone oxidoreductase subunit J
MTPFPFLDIIVGLVFLGCLAVTVGGALLAVLATRIIRSVCGLAICSFGLAGLYYFLHSPFLALMEILIYVGAVCVTIIFAVMLAEPDEPGKKPVSVAVWSGLALFVSAAICAGLSQLGIKGAWNVPVGPVGDGSVKAIGLHLLTNYSMAFELISLVLLVAILGALAIARLGRNRA